MHKLLLIRGNPFLIPHISPPYLLTSREQKREQDTKKQVHVNSDSETKIMAKTSPRSLQTKIGQ